MAAKPTRPAKPVPKLQNGRPAGGKHVPSSVPGAGAYDARGTVNRHIAGMGATGSNVTPAKGPRRQSQEVLEAPPWQATNPNAAQWMPPLN